MPTPELTEEEFAKACKDIYKVYDDSIKKLTLKIAGLESNNLSLQAMLRRTYNGRLPTCIQLLSK